MTDKPKKFDGHRPDFVIMDEITAIADNVKWTCYCGSKGHGMADMFEHVRVHLDREGEVALDLRSTDYSIIDPKETDHGYNNSK